jgi:hypothetical protein
MTGLAADLLNEADHLYSQELLGGASHAGPSMRTALQTAQANLQRAREIMHNRPASAVALASEVLRDLDRLVAARDDVAGAL